MVKIELFVLFGMVIGIPLGVLGSHFVRKYIAWRDSHVLRIRVQENLHEVHTDTLIEELSEREDLTDTMNPVKTGMNRRNRR